MSERNSAELASEIGYELAHAARRWRKALDDALASAGLTEATWRPLIHLRRLGDGARQNDLARSLGIERPSLVPLLDRLEQARLIERREDPSDRRANTLRLTAEGAALAARLQTVVSQVCDGLVEGLDPRDLEACARVLSHVRDRTGQGA